jgi:hypothetical protein
MGDGQFVQHLIGRATVVEIDQFAGDSIEDQNPCVGVGGDRSLGTAGDIGQRAAGNAGLVVKSDEARFGVVHGADPGASESVEFYPG